MYFIFTLLCGTSIDFTKAFKKKSENKKLSYFFLFLCDLDGMD